MNIYTIGFTKKSAETFFNLIRANNIELLIDIRLNNSSQLAGFSKSTDLSFFLEEICDCKYRYEPLFAPTKDIADSIKLKKITLEEYETQYASLAAKRNILDYFKNHYGNERNLCFLCSEEKPDICHRRVLAELISEHMEHTQIIHL